MIRAAASVLIAALWTLTFPNAAATGGPDPIILPPSMTTPPITCHTDSIGSCGGTADVVAFHNDETLEATWWVHEGSLSGPVVYWQCTGPDDEPGPDGYTGDPSTGPSQDGIIGSTVPLSDFDTTPGVTYSIEAFLGCWEPCDPASNILCVPLDAFRIGSHAECIHGA